MLRQLNRAPMLARSTYCRLGACCRPLTRAVHTSPDPPDGVQELLRDIRSAMIEKKNIALQLPGRMVNYHCSWSDLAGHGSFMFLACSYLESDFLNLRMFAMSGITLSILFQYYREKPLWLPIGWNSLFLLINAVMIGALIKDDLAADNLSAEEKKLYHDVFEMKGMSKVDFHHLMAKAKHVHINSGDKLVDETKQNTRLYLVQKGRVSVRKGNSEVGSIKANMFVGAMSFLTWDTRQEADLHVKDKDKETSTTGTAGGAEEGWIAWASSYVSTAAALVSAEPVLGLGTGSSQQQDKDDEGQFGHADAVAVDDCTVYYWRFKDLRRMKSAYPSMGMAVERCISDDLNRKMHSTWEKEVRERYKQLLLGATSDGQVTEHVKTLLSRCRKKFNVSDVDHLRMLKEVGWSIEEYTTGFKGCHSVDVLATYQTLLTKEMAQLDDAARGRLRQFRQENHISGVAHLNALTKLGWTLDDYEAGAQQVAGQVQSKPVAAATVYPLRDLFVWAYSSVQKRASTQSIRLNRNIEAVLHADPDMER